MSKQRPQYKVRNWSQYNKSLVNRGSITLWVDENLAQNWHHQEPPSGRGSPKVYSALAIELCLTLKALYHLPYRATEGLVRSLFALLGIQLPVPSYTQMSRRCQKLNIPLKRATAHNGPVDIVIDSTGLKIYGEGEWKVRQHGKSKRRTWKKLHLGVDPLSGEILTHRLTDNSVADSQVFDDILEQVPQPIERCVADGAYDTQSCYQSCYQRKAHLIVPPRRDAVEQRPEEAKDYLVARDRAIQKIQARTRELGDEQAARKEWKESMDYHIRSLAETAMFRMKTLCGDKLFSRDEQRQKQEVAIKVNIINKFTSLGMPISDPIYL